MAGKKTVKLEILVDDKASINKAIKQLQQLNKTADGTSETANKVKRNLEGVAGRANNAGKDFSRMSQGMGGLVQAYATVAANVFALSSAFRVLANAADISSMIKSTMDLGIVSGRSYTKLAADIKVASGAMLDFQSALQASTRLASVGASDKQASALVELATKAAQTFGGTTEDSINRFVTAIQKGETQLLKKTGIVVNTRKALEDYASGLGKTARDLSTTERQQAILNATLAEGQRVLGDVEIDPNPFQQLAVAFSDLKIQVMDLVNKVFTPLANIISKNTALVALISVAIVRSIAIKALPAVTMFIDKIKQMTAEAAIASNKRLQQTQTFAQIEAAFRATALTKQRAALKAETADLAAELTKRHGLKLKFLNLDFEGDLSNKQVKNTIKQLQQITSMTPEQQSAAGYSPGAIKDMEAMQRVLVDLASTSKIAGVETLGLSNQFMLLGKQAGYGTVAIRNVFSSEFISSMSNTSAQVSKLVQEKGKFGAILDIVTGKLNLYKASMNGAIVRTAQFGGVMQFAGRAAAFLGTSIALLGTFIGMAIGFAFKAFAIFSVLKIVFDKIRDTLFPLSEAQKKFNESMEGAENINKAVSEVSDNFAKLSDRISKDATDSVLRFSTFAAGTFETFNGAVENTNKSLASLGMSFDSTSFSLDAPKMELQSQISELQEARKALISQVNTGQAEGQSANNRFGWTSEARAELATLDAQIKDLEKSFKELSGLDFGTDLLKQFGTLSQAAQVVEKANIAAKNAPIELALQISEEDLKYVQSQLRSTSARQELELAVKTGDLSKLSEIRGLGALLEKDSKVFETITGAVSNMVARVNAAEKDIVTFNNALGKTAEINESLNVALNKLNFNELRDKEIYVGLKGLNDQWKELTESKIASLKIDTSGADNGLKEFSRFLKGNIKEANSLLSDLQPEIVAAALKTSVEAATDLVNNVGRLTADEIFEIISYTSVGLEKLTADAMAASKSISSIKIAEDVLKQTQELNKLTVSRAKSLDGIAAATAKGIKLEQQATALQIERAQAEIDVLKLTANFGEEQRLRIQLFEAEIAVLQERNAILDPVVAAIEAEVKAYKELQGFRNQAISAEERLLKTQIDRASSIRQVVSLTRSAAAAQREQLAITAQNLDAEIQVLEATRRSYVDRKESTQLIDAQLNSMRRQLSVVREEVGLLNEKRDILLAAQKVLDEQAKTYNEILNGLRTIAGLNIYSNITSIFDPAFDRVIQIQAELQKINSSTTEARVKIITTEQQLTEVSRQPDTPENKNIITELKRALELEKASLAQLEQRAAIYKDINFEQIINSRVQVATLAALDTQLKTQVEIMGAARENTNNTRERARLESRMLDLQAKGVEVARDTAEINLTNAMADFQLNKSLAESNNLKADSLEADIRILKITGDELKLREREVAVLRQNAVESSFAAVNARILVEQTSAQLALEEQRLILLQRQAEVVTAGNFFELPGPKSIEGAAKAFGAALGDEISKTLQGLPGLMKQIASSFSSAVNSSADEFARAIVQGSKDFGENMKSIFRTMFQEILANETKRLLGAVIGALTKIDTSSPEEKVAKSIEAIAERLGLSSEEFKNSSIAFGQTGAQVGIMAEDIDKASVRLQELAQQGIELVINADLTATIKSIEETTFEQIINDSNRFKTTVTAAAEVMEGITAPVKATVSGVEAAGEELVRGLTSAFSTIVARVEQINYTAKDIKKDAPPLLTAQNALPGDPINTKGWLPEATKSFDEVGKDAAKIEASSEVMVAAVEEAKISSQGLSTGLTDINTSVLTVFTSILNSITQIDIKFKELLQQITNSSANSVNTINAAIRDAADNGSQELAQIFTAASETTQEVYQTNLIDLNNTFSDFNIGVKTVGSEFARDLASTLNSAIPESPTAASGMEKAADKALPTFSDIEKSAEKPEKEGEGISGLLKSLGEEISIGTIGLGVMFQQLVPQFDGLMGMIMSQIMAVVVKKLAMSDFGAGGFLGFAEGGIIKGGIVSTASIPHMATGGLVSSPTVAMIGEGSRSEAVVPLPNNREIPVDMRNMEPAGDTINFNQNFDFRNADANSVGRLRAESERIKKETMAEIFNEINRGGSKAKISGRR
jgi:hypothetical protein